MGPIYSVIGRDANAQYPYGEFVFRFIHNTHLVSTEFLDEISKCTANIVSGGYELNLFFAGLTESHNLLISQDYQAT